MKVAFPTDEHVPFQDDRAREVALQIVRDFVPDLLIAGSDGLDFYQISSFDKNPTRMKAGRLQHDIDTWKEKQKEWQSAAPQAKRKYLPGNHEDRVRKYLWRHPEIAGLKTMELPNLLGLESLGIEWTEKDGLLSNEVSVSNELVIKHGSYVRKQSGMSARAELEHEHFSISILTGHTHRGGSFLAQTRRGVVQAQECFCLCRLDPEYMSNPDWQQGIVLAEVNGAVVSIEAVPIHTFRRRKVAIWRGKEYRA